MKTTRILNTMLLLAAVLMAFSSCLDEGEETIILENHQPVSCVSTVVDSTTLALLQTYMPIYCGLTPPAIEGTYVVDPVSTVYSQDTNLHAGNTVTSRLMRFSAQNGLRGCVDYETRTVTGSSHAASTEADVRGSGNNFTVYFTAKGASNGVATTTLTVISGTRTDEGIANLYYAIMLAEKVGDSSQLLMESQNLRIFADDDGMSYLTDWQDTNN